MSNRNEIQAEFSVDVFLNSQQQPKARPAVDLLTLIFKMSIHSVLLHYHMHTNKALSHQTPTMFKLNWFLPAQTSPDRFLKTHPCAVCRCISNRDLLE